MNVSLKIYQELKYILNEWFLGQIVLFVVSPCFGLLVSFLSDQGCLRKEKTFWRFTKGAEVGKRKI